MGNEMCRPASKGIKTDKPRPKRRLIAKDDGRPGALSMAMNHDCIQKDRK
jgi:hypothetical protein